MKVLVYDVDRLQSFTFTCKMKVKKYPKTKNL